MKIKSTAMLWLMGALLLGGCTSGDLDQTLDEAVSPVWAFGTSGFIGEDIRIPYLTKGAMPYVYVQNGVSTESEAELNGTDPFCAFKFSRIRVKRHARLMQSLGIDHIPVPDVNRRHGGIGSRIGIFRDGKSGFKIHISFRLWFLKEYVADLRPEEVYTESELHCYQPRGNGLKTEITNTMTLGDLIDILKFEYQWIAPNV